MKETERLPKDAEHELQPMLTRDEKHPEKIVLRKDRSKTNPTGTIYYRIKIPEILGRKIIKQFVEFVGNTYGNDVKMTIFSMLKKNVIREDDAEQGIRTQLFWTVLLIALMPESWQAGLADLLSAGDRANRLLPYMREFLAFQFTNDHWMHMENTLKEMAQQQGTFQQTVNDTLQKTQQKITQQNERNKNEIKRRVDTNADASILLNMLLLNLGMTMYGYKYDTVDDYPLADAYQQTLMRGVNLDKLSSDKHIHQQWSNYLKGNNNTYQEIMRVADTLRAFTQKHEQNKRRKVDY